MFQWAEEVALAVLRAVNIAVNGKDLVCGIVYSGVAHKWSTHIVVLYIPEAAHLNPLLAVDYNGAVEWAHRQNAYTVSCGNLLNGNHI